MDKVKENLKMIVTPLMEEIDGQKVITEKNIDIMLEEMDKGMKAIYGIGATGKFEKGKPMFKGDEGEGAAMIKIIDNYLHIYFGKRLNMLVLNKQQVTAFANQLLKFGFRLK